MKLLNYYDYIQCLFIKKCKNQEQSEDLVQDYFCYYWENRHKLNDHISLRFIKISVDYFYSWYKNKFRTSKRTEVINHFADTVQHPTQEEFVYTKELISIVSSITRGKIKNAIIELVIEGGSRANNALSMLLKINTRYIERLI